MDKLSTSERSQLMAKVRGSDTKPERNVRRVAHALGLRFRLHRRDLPGTPDLVFPKHRLALFVHGCFWHRHPGCKRATMPRSRAEFWRNKLSRNVARDQAAISKLREKGWRVKIIWECETRQPDALKKLLNRIFRPGRNVRRKSELH